MCIRDSLWTLSQRFCLSMKCIMAWIHKIIGCSRMYLSSSILLVNRTACSVSYTHLEYIGIAGEDGLLHSTAFQKPELMEDQAFYRALVNDEPYISDITRQIFYDRAAGGIVMGVPILGGQKQMLVAMISTEKLGEDVQVESFGGKGYTYICLLYTSG